jgi:hypothetical protein
VLSVQSGGNTFIEAGERYRRSVLRPAGLDFDESEIERAVPSIRKKTLQNCTFIGKERVWKFYEPRWAKYVRNAIGSSELLRARGISAVRVLFADAEAESVERNGLACLITERVQGDCIDFRVLGGPGGPLAPLLARLHGLRSTSWGRPGLAADDRYPELWVERSVAGYQAHIERCAPRASHGPLPEAIEWFRRNSDQLRELEGGFSFTLHNLNEENIRQTDDGALHLIDLDRCGFRLFAMDIARVIEKINLSPPAYTDPQDVVETWERPAAEFLEDYFREAPGEFRRGWERVRRFFFLLTILRDYSRKLRSATPEGCEARGKDLAEVIRQAGERRELIEAMLRT